MRRKNKSSGEPQSWRGPSVGYSLLTVTLTVYGAEAHERRCSFINVKEQDTVTDKQALTVTDRNCQIQLIHPAVTLGQPSLSIRDRKRERAGACRLLKPPESAGNLAAKPQPRSRFTARDEQTKNRLNCMPKRRSPL